MLWKADFEGVKLKLKFEIKVVPLKNLYIKNKNNNLKQQ